MTDRIDVWRVLGMGDAEVKALRETVLARAKCVPPGSLNTHGQRAWRTRGDIAALRDSIDVGGQLYPVVVRPDGGVLDGYRRILAVEQLDTDSILAVEVRDLAEAAAAFGLSDNTCRVAASFHEQMMVAELVNTLPRPPGYTEMKAIVTAAIFGATRSTYYGYHQFRKWAADLTLPDDARRWADNAREESAARSGVGVRTLYNTVQAVVKAARKDPSESIDGWDVEALPPQLARVVRVMFDMANNAAILTNVPIRTLTELSERDRESILSVLSRTERDVKRVRRIVRAGNPVSSH